MIGIPSQDFYFILKYLNYSQMDSTYIGRFPDITGSITTIIDVGVGSNPLWIRDTITEDFRVKSPVDQYAQGYEMIDEIKELLLGQGTINIQQVTTDQGNDGIYVNEDKLYVSFQESTEVVDTVNNSIDYIRFVVNNGPTYGGIDENNRHIFSLVMEMTRDGRTQNGNRKVLE